MEQLRRSLDNNEYLQTYMNTGSGGWYRPADSLITCAWSFNTYRVHNSMPQTYSFQLAADAFGSQGGASEFMGMVVVQNSVSGTSFLPLNMQDAQTGSLILNLMPEDTTAYFIIASVPEVFTGVDQRFGYDMRIETIGTGIHAVEAARNLIEEFPVRSSGPCSPAEWHWAADRPVHGWLGTKVQVVR
ncbi:MAG: hypothetical protein IPG10_08835 [Flavobacteriales bacterium]|nr:hypothetical protein [Flavobacteriales bacterium]